MGPGGPGVGGRSSADPYGPNNTGGVGGGFSNQR